MSDYPYLVEGPSQVPRGMLDRHPLTALRPDDRRISLYCREKSHADTPWFVASFSWAQTEAGPWWAESPYYPMRGGVAFWIGYQAASQLQGNDLANPNDVTRFTRPDFRVRYSLRCKLCGLKRDRRSDLIQRHLDKLWNSGVLELSLAAYAATFSSNA